MADTGGTLVTEALLEIGVLADEETPSSSQMQGGLRRLNNMIDALNIEGMMVYGQTQFILPLVAGQASYTIGPTGNLNVVRPNSINNAYIRDVTLPAQQQQDIPIYVYNDEEWQQVPFKAQQSTYPFMGVWFNSTSPLLVAYVNPVPNTSQYSLIFWANNDIGNLTQDTVISLAPGYKRMLISNLAIELCPSYGVQPSEVTIKIAIDSKAKIKINNYQVNEMETRFGGVSFDIRTNRYWRAS